MVPLTYSQSIGMIPLMEIIGNFLSKINKLLDKYMPLKKISNKEFKGTYNPG